MFVNKKFIQLMVRKKGTHNYILVYILLYKFELHGGLMNISCCFYY